MEVSQNRQKLARNRFHTRLKKEEERLWVADWQSDGEIGRIIKMKKEKGKRRKIVARQKTQDQEIFAMSFYLERNSPFFVMEIGF